MIAVANYAFRLQGCTARLAPDEVPGGQRVKPATFATCQNQRKNLHG